jgi:hypothetical protein
MQLFHITPGHFEVWCSGAGDPTPPLLQNKTKHKHATLAGPKAYGVRYDELSIAQYAANAGASFSLTLSLSLTLLHPTCMTIGVCVGSVWGPCGVRIGFVWGPCLELGCV